MKTSAFLRRSAAVLFALAAAARPLPAADAPAATHSPREIKELAAVEQFLDLDDAELDQLQQVIDRIRAMTPDQRTALRREIAAYRQLPETQREQMRRGWGRTHPGMGAGSGWGQMPAQIQDGWREMMQGATPEQHAAIQAQLQSLPPDQRTAYRRQLVEAYLKSKASRP
jgi:Protein of unknown function (DUF3106)